MQIYQKYEWKDQNNNYNFALKMEIAENSLEFYIKNLEERKKLDLLKVSQWIHQSLKVIIYFPNLLNHGI